MNATGYGEVLFTLSYQYNIVPASSNSNAFNLSVELNPQSTQSYLSLHICLSYIPDDIDATSNMAVLQVQLPTGFVVDLVSLNALVNGTIGKVEADNDNTLVYIYFNYVDANVICVDINAILGNSICYNTVAVLQKPFIEIYDYYSPRK